MTMLNLPNDLSFLEPKIKDLGFSSAAYCLNTVPISFDKYQSWINHGLHGEMSYLKTHLPQKENLKNLNPCFNSIISFLHPYRALNHTQVKNFSALNIALYAQDDDYHDWLKEKLDIVVGQLQRHFPEEIFFSATDLYPILERDFAYQNGLGWIGKNSCLINTDLGSLFLIGNIVSSLQINTQPPSRSHDFCGKCNRCIEACPTNAINADKTLDAKKCISYWSIEAKSVPPLRLRKKFQDLFFGCDICQTACPWNHKLLNNLHQNSAPTGSNNPSIPLIEELKFILTSSTAELKTKLKSTALSRAKAFGLRRNALIVIANLKLKELRPQVSTLISDEKLTELATWTLNELDS